MYYVHVVDSWYTGLGLGTLYYVHVVDSWYTGLGSIIITVNVKHFWASLEFSIKDFEQTGLVIKVRVILKRCLLSVALKSSTWCSI